MTRAGDGAARARRAVHFFLKLLVSVSLIVLIIQNTDTAGIMDRLLGVPAAVTLTAAAVMASLAALPARRWKIVLRLSGREFSTANLYRLVMIGNFFGQAIPSMGADGVRAWYVYRHGHGISLTSAINSVLLDRLSALAALLLLVFFSLPWLRSIVPAQIVWWTISVIVVAALGGLVLLLGTARLPDAWGRWRIVAGMQQLSHASRALIRSWGALLQVISLSLTVHLLLAVFVYGLAKAVLVPVGLVECLLLIPLVILVSTIPIGIAGWGVREGAMVVAFGFLNIPPSDALLVSILYGIVLAISSTPGLIFWMMMGRELKMEIRPDGK